MNTTGSIWQRWDLHIHTHASFHWEGKQLQQCSQDDRAQICLDITTRINAIDICAVCIMDYWTFDGYLLLRDYIEQNSGATQKTIFPGIELRMEAPTDFRLNTHVLFSEDVLPEVLTHFLSHLKMGGPHGKPPSRQNIIEVAREYDGGKLRLHGFTVDDRPNDERMLHLGHMTIVVSRESVQEAIEVVGSEKCLLISALRDQ